LFFFRALVRRRLRLKARSKVEVEERDGGLFIRPARPAKRVEPIEYPPAGSLKLSARDYALDDLAGPDFGPEVK
jgi:bifunctional DNA-binding transcriptional regulator/antitoxin component of YhaV-PrlF toxin-antitoxin module